MINRFAVVVVLLLVAACGGGSKSPSTPTPTIAQVGGLWGWVGTRTGVSGGDCVGPFEAAQIGQSGTGTLTITQNGSTLTARSTSDGGGETCDYTGTAGTNSIVLNGTGCNPTARLFLCASGASRDVVFGTLAVNATLNGSSLSGTSVVVYNVLVTGSGVSVALMTLTASYTATRR